MYSPNYKPNVDLLKSPKIPAVDECNMIGWGMKEMQMAGMSETWTSEGSGPDV